MNETPEFLVRHGTAVLAETQLPDGTTRYQGNWR
jgi:hypothetical protein